MLYALGVISRGQRFYPDQAITMNEAIKMVVCTLGYNVAAEDAGGYPRGHIVMAAKLGLLRGVSTMAGDAPIARGGIAKILFNSLEVEYCALPPLEVEETQLDKMNIIVGKGYIRAVGDVSVGGYTASRDKAVLEDAGGNLLEVATGGLELTGNLGVAGKYYLRSETDGDTLLYFSAAAVPEVIISAADIDGVTDTAITYATENRMCTETFSSDIQVIYNGKRAGTGDIKKLLWPEMGSVRLVATSGTLYDIAYVTAYEAYVVDAVNPQSERIIPKASFNGRLALELGDYDSVIIRKDGKEITLADVKQWDVMHLAESYDGLDAVIEISSQSINGQLTAISEDAVFLGEDEYPIDKRGEAGGIYPALKIGNTYAFYLNFNGQIFAWNATSAAEGNYGYLIAFRKGNLGTDAKIQLYGMNGSFAIYTLRERVKINDTMYNAGDFTDCAALFEGGTLRDQLIEYSLSSDGMVSEIRTAQTLPAGDDYDEDYFTLVLENDLSPDAGADAIIRMDHFNNGKFNDTYVATKETKVMIVPNDFDRQYFEITNVAGAFTDDNRFRDNKPLNIGEVMLYNANRYYQVPMIVCKMQKSAGMLSMNTNSPVLVVDKCTRVLDAEGEIRTSLQGMYNGSYVAYSLAKTAEGLADSVKKGMGLQIKLEQNEIKNLRVLFDIEADRAASHYVKSMDGAQGENEGAAWNNSLLVFYGSITDKAADGEHVVVSTGLPWDITRGFYARDMKIYRYNSRTGSLEIGSYDDIICSPQDPAEVFFRAYRSLIKDLIIID